MKTRQSKKSKFRFESSTQTILLHTTAKEFLDWVKFTYILPKPEITYKKGWKEAHVILEIEDSYLSIDVNPTVSGVELISKCQCNDFYKFRYDFDHGVGELDQKNLFKKVIVPKEMSQIPKPEATKAQIKEPWEFSRPHKQERDKIIWTMKKDNAIWNAIQSEITEKLGLVVANSTIRKNYNRMKLLMEIGK